MSIMHHHSQVWDKPEEFKRPCQGFLVVRLTTEVFGVMIGDTLRLHSMSEWQCRIQNKIPFVVPVGGWAIMIGVLRYSQRETFCDTFNPTRFQSVLDKAAMELRSRGFGKRNPLPLSC